MLTVIDIITSTRQLSDRARENYQAIEQYYNLYDNFLCIPADYECMSILMGAPGYSGRLGQGESFKLGCIYFDIQCVVRSLDVSKIFVCIDALTEFCASCHPALASRKIIALEMQRQLEDFMSSLRLIDSALNDDTILVHIRQLFDYFCASLIMKKYPAQVVRDAACAARREMIVNPVYDADEIELEQLLDLDCRFDECIASDIWVPADATRWAEKQGKLVDFFVELRSLQLLELFSARYSLKLNPKLRSHQDIVAVSHRKHLSLWSTQESQGQFLNVIKGGHEMVTPAIK